MNAIRSMPRSHVVVTAFTALALFFVGANDGGADLAVRHGIGIVAWLIVLISLAFVPRPRRSVMIVAGTLLALTAWTALSLFWTESAELTVYEITRVLTYLGIFLAVAMTAQRVGRRPIVDGLTFGFAGLLVLSALSRLEPGLFPAEWLEPAQPELAPRLTYPINYWNGLGAFAAMALPFFLHWATRPDLRPRIRALGAAVIPVLGLVLYLTFSRGALVGATLAAVVFLIASPTRWEAVRPLALSGRCRSCSWSGASPS